jgi:hypothetical protein
MRTALALFVLIVLAPLARGEDVWRWKDANGTLHYSNRADVTPPEAAPVTTRLTVETDRLPGAPIDVADRPARRYYRHSARPHRIYTPERLRFDCYAANVLYSGGWAHPDDINEVGNCLPYMLGPEAWLNGARAELALREHGIDWREIVPMYLADREPEHAHRVTAVDDAE